MEYQIPTVHQIHPNIIWVNSFFEEIPKEPRELILISWPWEKTTRDDLTKLAKIAKRIVVLAQTHGGTQCGTPQLWEFLKTLKIAAYCRDIKNDLIVYENIPETREELPTETAGIDMENIMSYAPHPTVNLL